VDASSDEVLPSTTKRKVSMGLEGGRHSPLRIWFLILEHQV